MQLQPVAVHGQMHLVQFYESEDFLAASVAGFLGPQLDAAGGAVIIASEDHRDRILAALTDAGVPVAAALAEQRLVAVDAASTLARVMSGARADPSVFRSSAGAALDRAQGGAAPDAPPVRVYSEMAALLWQSGNLDGLFELEELWNRLTLERSFDRLCAYALDSFDGPADAGAFARVCSRHTAVIPGDRYAALADGDDDGRRRVVAGLQQEVMALRRRVAELEAGSATRAPQRSPGTTSGEGLAHAGAERVEDLRIQPAAAMLYSALRSADHGAAARALEQAVATGLSATALASSVIPAAMHMIGAAWARSEISIEDEQAATATCGDVLAELYPWLLTHRPRTRECVLVTVVPGDAHGLGARLLSDVLEGRGYDVVLMTDLDTPAQLARAVDRAAPDLVALSATVVPGGELVQRAVAAVRAARPEALIVLGGQGVDGRWARAGFPVADSIADGATLVGTVLRERPPMPSGPVAEPPLGELHGTDRRPTVTERDPDALRASAAVSTTAAMRILDPTGRPAALVGGRGLLAREQALRDHEARLRALEDPVTGLPNHRWFEEQLARVVAETEIVSLLLIDIDEVHRASGLLANAQLVEVANTISGELRGEDALARLRGAEFGVVLRDRASAAVELADRIRVAVKRASRASGTTVSIGVAGSFGDNVALLACADRALQTAQRRGGNLVCSA